MVVNKMKATEIRKLSAAELDAKLSELKKDLFMEEIDGITIEVPAQNKVIIHGIDKQKVGQFAANVRAKRPPEPYKGKGIKYTTEIVRHKEGKAGGAKK